MSAARRTIQVAAVVMIVSLAGAVATLRAMDHLRRRSRQEDVLYLRSPQTVKRLSLGYTGLVADLYWTRAVQYFGYQHHIGSSDFHLLAPLLEIATGLDPKLVPAYQFGANYLAPPPPNGAGEPQKALELAKFGVEHNPDQWRLFYNLGFIYYMEFKDYGKAADAFARGAKLPIHNEFMPILAAQMAQHAGEFETSRMLWITTYESTQDAQIQRNALDHLRALRVDEDVTVLEQAVAKYRESEGRPAAKLADLEIAGVIRGVPADPTGLPYVLAADGRVQVQNPDSLPFITKGTPPGYQPPKLKADAK